MRNGSSSEYYLVEGGLKLTRVRQSEWRRRWGIQNIQTFDGQVGAGADDGYSNPATFQPSFSTLFLGTHASNGATDVWARFTNVTIPGGATILTAHLTVVASSSATDGANMRSNIYAEDVDDASAPSSKEDHAGKSRTTAFTAWDSENFTVDLATDSDSIVDVIQEITDRGSWSSGNALQILWDDDGSGSGLFYQLYPYETDSAKAIKLHVEYAA